MDPRQRLVDGRLPGRHRATVSISTGSSLTGPCTSRLATGTRPGSTASRSRCAGITATTADPRDGRIERDADGPPGRHAPGGCARDARRPVLPLDTDEELVAALRLAQAELHALGITSWQDAHGRARDRRSRIRALADRGELTARVVGALWWDETRGAEQIEELVERRARTATAALRADERQVHRRMAILENFTGAVLEPYLDRDGRPTVEPRRQPRSSPPPSGRPSRGSTRSGSRSHFHAHRRPRRARRARCRRGRAAGERPARHPAAHRAPPGRPPGRPRRGSERSASWPTSQAYWAVLEDQMDELTIPFVGPERAAPACTRSGRCCAAGATLAMGSDWSVSTADPLLEMEVAVERVSRRASRPATGLPARPSGSTSTTRWPAFTLGSAWANHLDAEVGIDRGRQGGRPRGARSRPVRPWGGCDRRGPRDRHVHRRRGRVRGT